MESENDLMATLNPENQGFGCFLGVIEASSLPSLPS
jgi:hypothetical protein